MEPTSEGSQSRAIYTLTVVLMVLSFAIGAVGTYYWSLQQQLVVDVQKQVATNSQPVIPASPRIIAPASTDTIYKNIPFEIRWSPMRLEEGEAVQIWIGHSSGTMAEIDEGKDVKLETGSHMTTVNDEIWNYVKPTFSCQKADLQINIGHYEKTGPGVLQFITQSSMGASVFVSERMSAPKADCSQEFVP